MGKLIIATPTTLPTTLKSKFGSNACEMKDLGSPQDNAEYFGECLRIGGQTSVGAQIISDIESSDTDITIVPVVSYYEATSSQFLPKVPCVIIDVMNFGSIFVPAEKPEPLRPTVILFHELGHASQWLTRRAWFESVSVDEIEADNLVRHEQPLCKVLGQPIRMHYLDTHNSAEKAKERWVQMNSAAIVIQRAVRGFLAGKEQ